METRSKISQPNMTCILCERLDGTNFYNFNETHTLHSLTPISQFLEKIIRVPFRVKKGGDELICGFCFKDFNEVDRMEIKIKEITNNIKFRYKKRQKGKEQIVISSVDHSEIYSVITVDDAPGYFDYEDGNESLSPKGSPEIDDSNGCDEKKLNSIFLDNDEVNKETPDRNGRIHFTDQLDLKNILTGKIRSEEESENWDDDIAESHNVSVLYDMMDEKNVGIFLEPKTDSSSKKSLKCSRCDLSFPTRQELKSHISTHEKDKPFICEVCGKVYRHKSALNIHVGMHNGITPFKCSHCNKTFTQKGAMMRHNKIHTGEKPYQCEECGKCFTHHTSFNIHKISHTGEKSYKCNVCGLMLMSTSHLKRHMRVHTGEKRYSCSTCGKRFAEKYNLMSHSKLHLNDDVPTHKKKFRCDLCNLVFYKRLHLEEHVAKNHLSKDDNYEYC